MYRLLHAAWDLVDGRISTCRRRRIRREGVEVRSSEGRSYYFGFRICGSRDCPVCSLAITFSDQAQLQAVADEHHKSGGRTWMLTITIPHGKWDHLPELLDRQAAAWRWMIKQRAWRALVRGYDLRWVRAFEATYGKNGWHPHYHVLLFVGPGAVNIGLADEVNQIIVEKLVHDLWTEACVRNHLSRPHVEYGVKLHAGGKAAKYVAKWTSVEELTLGRFKQGRNGSRTPFGLLQQYAELGDCEAGDLYKQYVKAMHRRNRLSSCRAIKLKADEADDTASAESATEVGVVSFLIPPRLADLICRHRLHAQVLTAGERGGLEAVEKLLARVLAQSKGEP